MKRVVYIVDDDSSIILIYDLDKLFSHEDQERILKVKAKAEKK